MIFLYRVTTRTLQLQSNLTKRCRLSMHSSADSSSTGSCHAVYQQSVRRLLSTSASSSTTTTSGPSFFSSPLQWWRNRQEVNELEKYKLRIVAMAEKDNWLIGDAIKEIAESLDTWKAKVPGASSMNEIKLAKEMVKHLNGIAKVVGDGATEETIMKMTHKDKLLAAVNGETTLESVNTLIEQFCSMSLLQRVLHIRKINNKTLPTTPEAITALMKIEAPKLLSKEQKTKMGKEQAKRMMKRSRLQ